MMKKRASLIALMEVERLRLQRQKQLEEERERNIVRLGVEAKERSLRVAILSDSVQRFENLFQNVKEHKKAIRDNDEWTNYLKCENLPNTKVPSEVRSFFYKWQNSLREYWDQQINWWLYCDDRSMLTQTSIEDTRRRCVKNLREPTGRFYDRKLRLMMTVYDKILETLRRRKISLETFEDLITLRNEFRETMFKFLDVLTFEVIMHIDREMISINPLMAHYSYKSHDFVMFISTFKDVTLPPNIDKQKLIKMDPLNMNITISDLLDYGSSTIRGLWFKHDFFSDFCPSFKSPYEMKFLDFNAAVNIEWAVKKSMTDIHLIEMRKVREIYNQKMEEKRKEEEKKSKDKKKPATQIKEKTSKVSLKLEIEPPVVDEATYIDVNEEYLVYENEQFDKERERFLTVNLDLDQHELNMREYQITNGVLKIDALERPTQTVEINSQLFVRLDENPHVLKYKKFHHVYNELAKIPVKGERKSQFGKKNIDPKEKALAELMKVEVKLNEKVFWWESPTVCRWEPWEESTDFIKLDPEAQDFKVRQDDYSAKECQKLFKARNPCHYKKIIQLKDFDLTSPPEEIKLSVLMKNYLVPLMPDEYKFFTEQMTIYKAKRNQWLAILEAKKELEAAKNKPSSVNLKDFFKDASKNIDIRNMTYDDFKKFMDEKSKQPKTLFPIENRKLIEVLENLEIADFQKSQESLKVEASKESFEYEKLNPLNSEPIMLSELLLQVEKINESLKPFFREIEVVEDRVLNERKSGSIKSRKKLKVHVHLDVNRNSTAKRSSSRPSPKSRKFKSSLDEKLSVFSEKPSSLKNVGSLIEKQDKIEILPKVSHKLIPHNKGKWSTDGIYEQSYNRETKTVTFYTGKLGFFGFATRKYSNLPLKSWELFPAEIETEKFVLLKLETQFTEIEFKITNDGYTFKITTGKKSPPQQIENAVKFFELKKILSAMNFNLFPEVDAGCYVINNCEKHRAMEFHTYKSMAIYGLSHHFKSTKWNRWAHRRVAIFDSRMIDKKTFKRLMVTPLSTNSVIVREKCTELEVVELDYEITPPEQEFQPDLLNFLKDEVDNREHRANLKNFMMIWHVQALLMNIQPFSFSQ